MKKAEAAKSMTLALQARQALFFEAWKLAASLWGADEQQQNVPMPQMTSKVLWTIRVSFWSNLPCVLRQPIP